jgi:hypothetical protein
MVKNFQGQARRYFTRIDCPDGMPHGAAAYEKRADRPKAVRPCRIGQQGRWAVDGGGIGAPEMLLRSALSVSPHFAVT